MIVDGTLKFSCDHAFKGTNLNAMFTCEKCGHSRFPIMTPKEGPALVLPFRRETDVTETDC